MALTSKANDNQEPERENTGLSGYRLVDIGLLDQVIKQMACPACSKESCYLVETRRLGLNSCLEVKCSECPNTISSKTSPLVGEGKSKTHESNLLVVAAGKNCGIGYAKTVKFLGGLDVPKAMHLKTYQHLSHRIHEAAVSAVTECMEEAAQIAKRITLEDNPALPKDTTPVTAIYDGTWHKRGHSSHHGIGVLTDMFTGLVLDYEVLSNYCQGCATGPKPQDPAFNVWKRHHTSMCQNNYSGSANSMEVEAALRIFPRSVNLGLIYDKVICDGDAKTIGSLNELDPYGCEIQKEDCTNHVAKRMWKAIDNLRKNKSGNTPRLSGKGRITIDLQDMLTGYYAQALKDNAPDVAKMKDGVFASLMHIISTDDDHHHKFCEKGEKSWCHYQRSLALGEPIRKHRPKLGKEFAEYLLPVYDRLTEASLLQRCSRMKTQNVNECFNAQVWRRCPKTEATSLRSVQTATALAVLEFNQGPEGYHKVLEHLGLSPGQHQQAQSARARAKRLKRGRASVSEASVLKRRRHKTQRNKKAEQQQQQEGLLYESGAFNS